MGNKILLLFEKYFGYVCKLTSHLGWNLDLYQRFAETGRKSQFSQETWSATMFGVRDRIHVFTPQHTAWAHLWSDTLPFDTALEGR